MTSTLLASLRETRSRIRRALVTIQQAKDAETAYNQPIDECKEQLERSLDWIDEAIENVEARNA